jgi:ribonuclease P protein component
MKDQPPHTLPKTARIRKRREFLRLQGKERKVNTAALLLVIAESGGDTSRIGITVTTKVDKRASRRNAIKRAIREGFRRARGHLVRTFDIIVIARNNAARTPPRELRQEFIQALQRYRYLEASYVDE